MPTAEEKALSMEQIIWDRCQKAMKKRQKKDSLWILLDTFDRGEQWEYAGNIPSWVPKPVTNMIHLVKTTKRAAMAGDNMVGRLRAINPRNIAAVDKKNKVYQHEWKKTRMRKMVRECVETSRLLGTGIAHLYLDTNTGVLGAQGSRFVGLIKGCQIDPMNFYPDPAALTLEDCSFILIKDKMNIEWLKAHPKFKEGVRNMVIEHSQDLSAEEIYNRGAIAVEKDGTVDFSSFYEKKQNPEGGYFYTVTYLAGRKIIGTQERIPFDCYPFAILYDYQQRIDFWGKGICELILENQKLINKVESIIAMIGVLMQNPQKVVNKFSGIDPKELAKYSMAPGHTYVSNGDPTRAVYFIVPPQIPQQLFNLAEQAKQNIREITGLNAAYTGGNVGSLQTSSGVNTLVDRSTLRDQDQMYDLELFVEDISRLLLKMMSKLYTEERFVNIAGKGEKVTEESFISYVGTEFDGLDYEFENDVSAKSPLSRAKRKEDATNLLNLQGQYGYEPKVITPQEFILSQDMIDGEAILDRMNREEMQNEVEEAMQVATMMMEAMQNGIPQEEIQMMAKAMIEQMNDPNQPTGSTTQKRQQGVPMV